MKPVRKRKATAKLSAIPNTPGIYQFIDETGDILYIGKAKHLKKRVASYFTSKDAQKEGKTIALVKRIHHIDTISTQTEHEALVLENQLIKHHQPRYNIRLKDDKSYPYIRITTEEPYPRIIITRNKTHPKSSYFGPYPSLGNSKKMKHFLHDLFPLRDCTLTIDPIKKQAKCLKLDMEKCIGPCVFKSLKNDYSNLVNNMVLFLSGKTSQLIKQWEKEMTRLSMQKSFEQAAKYRDKIEKLNSLNKKQYVDIKSKKTIHIIATAESEETKYTIIQEIINGKLLYQHGKFTETKNVLSHTHFLENTLEQFYETHPKPDLIICEPFLKTAADSQNIQTICPKKGVKRHLLDSAQKNAKIANLKLSRDLVSNTQNPESKNDTLMNMKKLLSLQNIPNSIIGIDISHLRGENIVGSAVFFQNGRPKKSLYRHFKIKSIKGKSNDPASIYEVVLRRIDRLIREESIIPDLLLIDGGKGQLRFCNDALKSLPLPKHIDTISLAKREEEIYISPKAPPKQLGRNSNIRKLLQEIRDESHRFALRLQKKQRQKTLKTQLHTIPGLGDIKIKNLYQKFKTIDKVKKASIQDLTSIPGITNSLATKIIKLKD